MFDDCIFCKIVKGTIPSDVVYEDRDVIAFLDIKPVNPGHVLVIPKEHHPTLIETPDEVLKKVIVKSKELMKVIKDELKADFVTLSVVGTDVPHFHIHLIPRFKKDGLAAFWPTKESEKAERAALAKKLRARVKK